MRGIPARWEKYLPVGCRVPGTRFLPFKVPLKPELCRSQPESEWFTPNMVMESNPMLKAVIDLTNTDRYYNREEFTKKGLLYKKLKVFGGGKVPSKDVTKRFFDAVDEFSQMLEQDSDALIGVHCTHGLNRTGYLICKYMVHRLKFDPQEAINKFQEARGYEIERNNYVSNIIRESDNVQHRCPTVEPTVEPDQIVNWREEARLEPAKRQRSGNSDRRPANSGRHFDNCDPRLEDRNRRFRHRPLPNSEPRFGNHNPRLDNRGRRLDYDNRHLSNSGRRFNNHDPGHGSRSRHSNNSGGNTNFENCKQ